MRTFCESHQLSVHRLEIKVSNGRTPSPQGNIVEVPSYYGAALLGPAKGAV